MSLYFDRLRKDPLAEVIPADKSNFYVKRYEGEPYLFLDNQDLDPMVGHEIRSYYTNGVLLSIKDDLKYFNNSKSYIFYNNEGVRVFEIHNTKKKYNPEIAMSEPVEPEFDIEIRITERYVHVKEICFETKEVNEYFINIKTQKKLVDVFENLDKKDKSFTI